MNSDIKHFRTLLERGRGKQAQLRTALSSLKKKGARLEQEVAECEEAQLIIQTVAQSTQAELQYRISELGSLAMASVFDRPYKLKTEFVVRRGRTETEFWFTRNEKLISPLLSSGGGAVDVASFALQLTLWTLRNPRTRPVILIDEPLKWLKGGDLPEKGAQMIQQISEKLGIQIIMVSHIPEQKAGADRRIHAVLVPDPEMKQDPDLITHIHTD